MAEKDTKTRILDASEALFAENGFSATSLRSITTEAGVNLAAVNYHFGSKEALLLEVLGRHLEPLNTERIERLDEIEAEGDGEPPELEKVLRAFLLPAFRRMLDSGEAGARFIKLAGRIHLEPNPILKKLFIKHFEVVIRRYHAAVARALPDQGPEEIMMKVHFLVGAMIHSIAWSQNLEEEVLFAHPAPDPEGLVENLIRFSAAGFRATRDSKSTNLSDTKSMNPGEAS